MAQYDFTDEDVARMQAVDIDETLEQHPASPDYWNVKIAELIRIRDDIQRDVQESFLACRIQNRAVELLVLLDEAMDAASANVSFTREIEEQRREFDRRDAAGLHQVVQREGAAAE